MNNILKCIIKKDEIIGYHSPSKDTSEMYYINKENRTTTSLYLVPSIKIIMKDIQKKDLYVGIKKLLVNIDEYGVPILMKLMLQIFLIFIFQMMKNFILHL